MNRIPHVGSLGFGFTTKNVFCGLSKCSLVLQTIWNAYEISLCIFTIK